MNLGICTPYRHSETTAAALWLADLAISRSMTVKLLSDGPIQRGVHPYWDTKIHSPRDKGVYHWAKDCDYLAWFSYHPALLARAQLVSEGRTHALVVMPHQLPRFAAEDLVDYQRIICPSRAVYQGCVENVFGEENFKHLAWCPWDSGIEPVKRRGLSEEGKTKLYVPLDNTAVDEVGNFVIRVVNELLCWRDDLEITLDCAKTWPRQMRRELAAFLIFWSGRLRVQYRQTLLDQVTAFHTHDWTYLPSLRGNVGTTALVSLACHVPVIAYDIEPFSSIVRDRRSGFLLPCELCTNWIGMPIAEPQLASTLAGLQTCLTEVNLTNLRIRDWKLEARTRAFAAFWEHEWGLD